MTIRFNIYAVKHVCQKHDLPIHVRERIAYHVAKALPSGKRMLGNIKNSNINDLFYWRETSQGHDFWSDLYIDGDINKIMDSPL